MESKYTVSDVLESCINMTGDVKYCANIVDAVLYVASRRIFSYTPKGQPRPKFYLALSDDVDYKAGILTDKEKKSFIIVLYGPSHTVSLVYERGVDGRFALSHMVVSNQEYVAMLNGPLVLQIPPPEVGQ